jgi:predicted Rossmann fold flavoprotein
LQLETPNLKLYSMRRDFDVIVLGGGAAGLMCAIEAGKRGRRVAVLEHTERIGKKILISGGGRCNFTNLHCRPESFISANPHFCKSALARYTPDDFIALVRKHGIAYHEKTLGQLFCDGSAREIVAMLEKECAWAGVEILTGVKVAEVQRRDSYEVAGGDSTFVAPSLVVATGGLSIPKIGATSFGYDLARQFGLKIQPCRPGLVPLLFDAEDRQHYSDLAGVSADVIASSDGQHFREKMLFTHRGLSGPAILQVSSYWQPGEAIMLDLAPEADPLAAIRGSALHRDAAILRQALRSQLPTRFADRWLELHPPAGFTNAALDNLSRTLHAWSVTPDGTEGYEKAEVTAGGVDTDELSAKTMESRKVAGLYFVGEVVDVTGHLGGFNFQWAWASGFAAGQAV